MDFGSRHNWKFHNDECVLLLSVSLTTDHEQFALAYNEQ